MLFLRLCRHLKNGVKVTDEKYVYKQLHIFCKYLPVINKLTDLQGLVIRGNITKSQGH